MAILMTKPSEEEMLALHLYEAMTSLATLMTFASNSALQTAVSWANEDSGGLTLGSIETGHLCEIRDLIAKKVTR